MGALTNEMKRVVERQRLGFVATVELSPRQGFVVPKGVMHRPRARKRTVILMVEGAGIVPTGDA